MSQELTERGSHMVDGWRLTPEGAAIHLGERTAVVADLHLGYEWARGAAGDCVLAHSLHETLARLSLVLDRAPVRHLIVAGDLVESPRPCPRTYDDIRRLREWLAGREVTLSALEGNHDRWADRASRVCFQSESPIASASTCTVSSWTIGHGHRPIRGQRIISGHHHPVLRLAGTCAPCFLVGHAQIVLPAFSSNAAGCDVGTARVPRIWLTASLRCLASTGSDLLDFGRLPDLRRKLRR
jgi:putative SbcD/Mre11-related phosphoesterase